MTSWHLNIWKVKIWLSHEQEELLKLNKFFFLVLKALYFSNTKQIFKNFKGCVRFFHFFFFFTKFTWNNYEKWFLFHLKSSFHYQDIQIFVFPSSPLFFRVSHWLRGWLKINLKVYGVKNCLNNNLITHFVWYHEKEKRYNIELCQFIEYYVRSIFMEKWCWKCAPKLVLDPFLVLLNNPKQPLHARNCFKNKIFWKRIIKKP